MRSLVGLLMVAAAPFALAASSDWQVQRLMAPTAAQLAAESRGAVVIYDGLEAGQVTAAMDRHFDRVQHMMFIRTYHPPTSEYDEGSVEEDGCD